MTETASLLHLANKVDNIDRRQVLGIPKCPVPNASLPARDPGSHLDHMVSRALFNRKLHLDQFIRFCRARARSWPTDWQTTPYMWAYNYRPIYICQLYGSRQQHLIDVLAASVGRTWHRLPSDTALCSAGRPGCRRRWRQTRHCFSVYGRGWRSWYSTS